MELIETITVSNISAYFVPYSSKTVTRDKNKEVHKVYELPTRIFVDVPDYYRGRYIYHYLIINDKIMLIPYSKDMLEIIPLTNDCVDMYYFARDGRLTLNDITIQPSGIVAKDVMFRYNIGSSCEISFGAFSTAELIGEPAENINFDIYVTTTKPIIVTSEKEAKTREIEITIPEGVTEYTTYFDVSIPFMMSIKRGLKELLSSDGRISISTSEYTRPTGSHISNLYIERYMEDIYAEGYIEDYVDTPYGIGFRIIRSVTEPIDETPVTGTLNNYHNVGSIFIKRRLQISPTRRFSLSFERW